MTSAVKLLLLLLTWTCGVLGGLLLPACRESPSPPSAAQARTISGSTMGTYFRVTLASLPEGCSEAEVQARVSAQLNRINSLMSTYDPDSEVSRFNRSHDVDWFPVSTETATVVAAALQVFAESDGAFDITVGPLVDLWGFGPPERHGQIPHQPEIDRLRQAIGSTHLHVRPQPPALKKDLPNLHIDLSAIAKGYAVDALATSLETLGITNFLVDIGGEMLARGEKKAHTPWQIAIERPTAQQRGIQTILPLHNQAIATSGDYRNYFEHSGRRYSHEIDPSTGQPIQHQLVSVSVMDPSCMHADAWATALIVLGPDEGLQLAKQTGLAAFFIIKVDDGFREIETPNFHHSHPP